MTELLERLDVINDRLNRLEAAQSDLQASVEHRPAERTVEPLPGATHDQAGAAPLPADSSLAAAAPSGRSAPPPPRATIYARYRTALALYGKSRWAEARAAFQQVFDAEPNGELADNALFWIGETYYAAGDYLSAMRLYTRVTKEYPNENKAPDAWFKLGLAYVKTGDLGMARRTFEETLKRYPYAAAATAAKAELARIRY